MSSLRRLHQNHVRILEGSNIDVIEVAGMQHA